MLKIRNLLVNAVFDSFNDFDIYYNLYEIVFLC